MCLDVTYKSFVLVASPAGDRQREQFKSHTEGTSGAIEGIPKHSSQESEV